MTTSFSSQPRTLIKPFAVLRELVNTHDAFYQRVTMHVQQFGLTTEQFDVIATLGNTTGLSLVELDKKTLLNQSDLIGVLNSLSEDQLIYWENPTDKPMMIVKLTPAGEKVFTVVFPIHLEYLNECFSQLNQTELDMLQIFLNRLKGAFEKGA